MPTEVIKNNVQTTLLTPIDSNDTVITPVDGSGFPATGEQARAAIGSEILIVTGGDGPQYDVTRGAEGTTAVGHAAGEALRLVLTADGFTALAALGSALRVVTRRLTTAELSTLGDTPVELVPGVPGALLMGVSVVGQSAPGTTPPFGSAPTFTVSGGASSNVLLDSSLSSSSAQFSSAAFVALGNTTAGAIGQPISISASENPTVSGAILTSSLDAGGSGYAEGDTGTVVGGDDNATYIVDTVDGGGAILTYTITAGGTGYIPTDYVLATTTGVDVGGRIVVDSIDPQTPDMEATFTVAYYVVPVA